MVSSRRRRIRAFAALAVTLACAGCAGSDLDVNPFYAGRVHEGELGREARTIVAGPLWDDARRPDYRETALHPFWRRVVHPTETRVQVLAPLYAARFTNDEVSHRFLALSFARTHRSSGTEPDYDFMLFPLLWAGNGPTENERYFALFPLFGRIKSFAAFAEAGFVLFPLYYYVRKEVSEPETLHSITPLIGWTSGGPRDGSVRVLPLFGHWKYEGKHDKWSVLWPIFHFQRNRLDTSDPSTNVAAWPLFGIERSERLRFLTFLWPFFRFRTERVPRVDEEGRAFEEVYFHHDFLWPLYRRQHTREFDYVRLFPFYSRYRSPELDSDAWAIPLFWKRQLRRREWTKDTFDFVPLVHWERKRFTEPDGGAAREDDTAFKLWPLFAVKREDGERDFKLPAPLPMDAERYVGDFEATWSPFWELLHTHESANGERHGNALFRLVDWHERAGRRRFSIPLVYSGDYGPRRSTHSLLLGILRFGGGEGGVELKLLGMPLLTPEVVRR